MTSEILTDFSKRYDEVVLIGFKENPIPEKEPNKKRKLLALIERL